MIRNIKVGRGTKEQQISILETPENGRNKNRKFLLMISGMNEEAGVYLNREELQELNENIAQTIAGEINNGK
jgi:hypothetical protein